MRKLLLAIIFLFFPMFVFAHGGEDHGDEKPIKEISQPNIKPEKSSFKLEKTISNNNGTFSFNIQQSPEKIYQGDKATFNLNVTEIIENSFIEKENLEFKTIKISIANNNKISNIDIKKEKDNIYSFENIFDNAGAYTISIETLDNESKKLNCDFKLEVITLPINYFPYTLDLVTILILLLLVFSFYKKSGSISQKITFTIVCLLISGISFFIVKLSFNFRIKPISNRNLLI